MLNCSHHAANVDLGHLALGGIQGVVHLAAESLDRDDAKNCDQKHEKAVFYESGALVLTDELANGVGKAGHG
jgi:hypothetical protein